MQRVSVTQGRNITEVGYDPETQTLEILFSSGGIYSYAAVPPEIHDKLIHAESPGSYFAIHVRPCYEYVHLNPKPKKEASDGENQESSSAKAKSPTSARKTQKTK